MPDFIVRVCQVQLLNGFADVSMTGDTPDQVADIILTAVGGDLDDGCGDPCYRLPDGRLVPLDPEDSVAGGRTYCLVLDGEHRIVGYYGDLTSCDFTEGALEIQVKLDLRARLADLRETAANYREVGGSFPLHGIGSLFEHLDGLDAVANAGPQLTAEEGATVRAVLDDAIMRTSSNHKAALLTAALRKLPHG